MVVLQCPEDKMEILSCEMQSQGFIDEDLDNMLTAVAFKPMTKEDGNEFFKNLRLA
jgi:hypothetical protein